MLSPYLAKDGGVAFRVTCGSNDGKDRLFMPATDSALGLHNNIEYENSSFEETEDKDKHIIFQDGVPIRDRCLRMKDQACR